MLIGVIGDDFTGSSDIANNLKKAGMSVSMYAGIPKKKSQKPSSQAIVIALKTRTIPVKEAIKESTKALDWLKNANCKSFISDQLITSVYRSKSSLLTKFSILFTAC